MMRTAIAFLLVLCCAAAYAAPSIKEIEEALHLYPGGRTIINVGGTQIEVEYIGIEPRHGHEYAIIVRAY